MDFKKVDEIIEKYKSIGTPMADCVVIYKGKTVYRKSYGYRDEAKTIPYDKDSRFWLYSCTKPITCTAAMRLVEEGKMSLSDPVSKYLPEFSNVTVQDEQGVHPAKETMLIQHLFSMTAGFTYDINSPCLKKAREDRSATTREVIKALSGDPLIFEPNTHFNYSLCHDVLAAVVEVVSGMKFSEYLKQLIFEPLGMNNTAFHKGNEKIENMCDQYYFDNGKILKNNGVNGYVFTDKYESGGAGLVSTVDDYVKFASCLANYGVTKEGYRILSHSSINTMRTNMLDTQRRNGFWKEHYGYGLGVRTMIDPPEGSYIPIGEYGWDGAACSYVSISPDDNIAIVFGTHVLGFGIGYELHFELCNAVHEAIKGDK